jgi:hypothetical protein
MMPTDIEKSPKHAIVPADHDNWLTGNSVCDEVAGLFDLVRASNYLPALAENGFGFQIRDARVNIPRRRNCGGIRQRCPLVIACENLVQRLWHDQTLTGQSKTRQSNIPKDEADFMRAAGG